MHQEEIRSIDAHESIQVLGVHMCFTPAWKEQFQVIIEKMCKSITKIMRMSINTYKALVHYNMCLIKTVFLDIEW